MSRLISFLVGSIFTFLLVAFLDYICYRPINYVTLTQQHHASNDSAHLLTASSSSSLSSLHATTRPAIVYVPATQPPGGNGLVNGGADATMNSIPYVVFDEQKSRMLVPPPKYDCRRMEVTPHYEQVNKTTQRESLIFYSLLTFINNKQCAYSPDQDVYVSASILSSGAWEGGKMNDMRRAWEKLRENYQTDIVFADVGANLGIYSLYAAACGVKRITSFEPLPPNLALFTARFLSLFFSTK